MSQAEVREALLAAARDVVGEHGATVGLELLNFERLIERADVPRSSAYKQYPQKGIFIDDLLCYLAERSDPRTATFGDALRATVGALVGDRVGRRRRRDTRPLFMEAVRSSVPRTVADLAGSDEWLTRVAIEATARFTHEPDARARLLATLVDTESDRARRAGEVYGEVAAQMVLRLRDPAMSFEQLALAVAALLEGFALRHALAVAAAQTPTDDDLLLAETGDPLPGESLVVGSQGQPVDRVLPRPKTVVEAVDEASADGVVVDVPPGHLSSVEAALHGPSFEGADADWSVAAFALLGVFDAFLEPARSA